MKPLELTFQGLRSYRTPQTITFLGKTLIGIIGDTGAGKSSILEAICFALYNCTTWDGRSAKTLIADGTNGTLSVTLTFSARGRIWKVSRAISARPQGLHRLEAVDGTELVEGSRVDTRIVELIGLDYKTFIKSVILPQGRFEQLLHSSTRDRADLLKSILGLDQLETLHHNANTRYLTLKPQLDALEIRRAKLRDNPRAAAAVAEAAAVIADERVNLLRESKSALSSIATERASHETRRGQLGQAAERLGAIPAAAAGTNLAKLAEVETSIIAEQRESDLNVQPLAEEYKSLNERLGERRPGGRDAEAITTALAQLPLMVDKLKIADVLATEIVADEVNLGNLRQGVNAKEDLAEQLRLVAVAAEEKVELAREHEAGARHTLESRTSTLTELRTAESILTALSAEVVAAEGKLAGAIGGKADAENVAGTTKSDHDSAIEIHEHHQRLNAAAHAATGLSDGDPCPICSHLLPEGFTSPEAPDLAAAGRLVKAAKRRADDAAKAVTEAIQAESKSSGEVLVAQANHGNGERERDRLLAVLVADLGPINLGLNDEALVQPLSKVAVELKQSADKLDEELQAHRKASGAARSDADLTEQNADNLETSIGTKRQQHGELAKMIATLGLALPGAYRPAGPQSEAATECLDQAQNDYAELQQIWTRLEELRTQIDAAAELCSKLDIRLQGEVLKPLAKLRKDLEALPAAHNHLAGLLDLPAIELPTNADSAAEHMTWISAAVAVTGQLLTLAHDQAARSARLAEGCDGRAATILAMADLNGAELDDALEAAIGDAAIHRKDHNEASAQIAEAERLNHDIATVKPHVSALSDIAALLQPGKFPAAMVAERQQTLLGTATGILREMTHGQFAFGPAFQVFDSHTGQLRDVKTLSGGETFQASLALALAVVEQAGSSGGLAEALFLDEGFGTLDQGAMAQALDALNTQVNAGRLVVVISHMRAVADQVPAILHVTKGPAGSALRWIDDHERSRLADDDLFASMQD